VVAPERCVALSERPCATRACRGVQGARYEVPIPALAENGWLPPGVHDATIEEVVSRFGAPMGSERRLDLKEKLTSYVHEVRQWGLAQVAIIDGSFVSGKPRPSDIDVALLVVGPAALGAEIPPAAESLLSQRYTFKRFAIDLKVCVNGTQLDKWIEEWTEARDCPAKGMVRVVIS